MLRKLLATTALTAFVAGGAYAQAQAEHEITVQAGDTVIIEAERENAQINLILHSGAAGVENQTPEQAAGQDGVEPGGTQQQTQAQDQDQQDGSRTRRPRPDRGQFEAPISSRSAPTN
jgi:hypothetical protein